MVKCPYCAEEIRPEAQKCKHCGEWLTDGVNHKPKGSRVDEDALGRALTEGMHQYDRNIADRIFRLAKLFGKFLLVMAVTLIGVKLFETLVADQLSETVSVLGVLFLMIAAIPIYIWRFIRWVRRR